MRLWRSARPLILGMLIAATASCHSMPAPASQPIAGPTFQLDREAAIQQLAAPPVFDWKYNRATTVLADERRRTLRPAARLRRLQSLSEVSNTATSAAPFSATGGITSAPAFHYLTDKAYWLTDTGYLLRYDVASSGGGAPSNGVKFQIKDAGGTNQTFKNSAITLSNDGARAYLCSLEGNFLVVNASTGATIYSYSIGRNTYFTNIGGTSPPDTMPAPWIDAYASRDDGQLETVYALANSGNSTSNALTLHRFTVDALASNSPTVTVTRVQGYTIPINTTSPYLEGMRAAPIVYGGKAVIGTWSRHSTNNKLDTGNVIYYDTACNAYNTAATTGALITKTGVPNPVWATPALDLDASTTPFTPFMAFVSGSFNVTAVHLSTQTVGNSVPLLVDKTTEPTTDSMGGTLTPANSLNNYPYSNTGIQTVSLECEQDGAPLYKAETVSEDATLLVGGSGAAATKNNQTFWSYSSNLDSDSPAHAAYAYVTFRYDTTDCTLGGESTPRGVNHVRVRLRCSVDSNPGCCGQPYDAQVPEMGGWLVKNTLPSSGAAWAISTIAPTDRPEFTNGDAFNFTNAAKAVHNVEKLLPDTAGNNAANGNKFRSGTNYDWLADGLISAGTDATFAWYDDNTKVTSGGKGGKPHNVGCPYFEGGTSGDRPKLILELSASGLATPAMLLPVAIDSETEQIFAVNTNALYRLSYQAFVNTGYTAASVAERMANLADTQKTFYKHTLFGQDATRGPIATTSLSPAKRYIGNLTAPLYTGSEVYVQDVFVNGSGVYNATSLTEFAPGTIPTSTVGSGSAPTRAATTINLTTTAADAQAGPTYMAYDFESTRLFTGTFQPSSTNGRVWIINR